MPDKAGYTIELGKTGALFFLSSQIYQFLVQAFPLLVTFDSPTPSLTDIVARLNVMILNAKAVMKSDRLNVESDRLNSVLLKQVIPYTKARWQAEGLDDQDFQVYLERAQQMATAQIKKWDRIKLLGSAAATLACVMPWGRSIRMVLPEVTRSLCLAGLGLPLNTYFLYGALADFEDSFARLTSSLDGSKSDKEVFQGLFLNKSAALLNLLIFPLSMNLVHERAAINAIFKNL